MPAHQKTLKAPSPPPPLPKGITKGKKKKDDPLELVYNSEGKVMLNVVPPKSTQGDVNRCMSYRVKGGVAATRHHHNTLVRNFTVVCRRHQRWRTPTKHPRKPGVAERGIETCERIMASIMDLLEANGFGEHLKGDTVELFCLGIYRKMDAAHDKMRHGTAYGPKGPTSEEAHITMTDIAPDLVASGVLRDEKALWEDHDGAFDALVKEFLPETQTLWYRITTALGW